MATKKNKIKQREMSHHLIENAFDFLEEAIKKIEKKPKYAVIHFQAAVELFIKARLMDEHWSLVIAPRTEPDWDRFLVGDFRSVSLRDAATRLKKVVGRGLTTEEYDAFDAVTTHRNKMVHFFR